MKIDPIEQYKEINDMTDDSRNNGGSTSYYELPEGATELQDLIEYKNLNFAQGNIMKAIYRKDSFSTSSYRRDLNKIIWFAQRELARLDNGKEL